MLKIDDVLKDITGRIWTVTAVDEREIEPKYLLRSGPSYVLQTAKEIQEWVYDSQVWDVA